MIPMKKNVSEMNFHIQTLGKVKNKKFRDTTSWEGKMVRRCSSFQISPVQPRQEAFGCSNKIHHRGKKVIR